MKKTKFMAACSISKHYPYTETPWQGYIVPRHDVHPSVPFVIAKRFRWNPDLQVFKPKREWVAFRADAGTTFAQTVAYTREGALSSLYAYLNDKTPEDLERYRLLTITRRAKAILDL